MNESDKFRLTQCNHKYKEILYNPVGLVVMKMKQCENCGEVVDNTNE